MKTHRIALNYSMVFWDEVFREVGAEYPDVETHSLLVDAAAMFMVRDPKRFQVVVAPSQTARPGRRPGRSQESPPRALVCWDR